MESLNIKEANIDKIGALFPNCITETADENGKLKKAINFEMLRAMLSEDIAEGNEAYEFTWVGKKAAIAEANRPIRMTLRPVMNDETVPTGKDSEGNPYCSSGSVNWDSTENLYIEGDNLEVLKLLQESYLGKVKMIYIDPPYNTGNDFIYRDDFAVSADDYAEESGQLDEDGNRLFKNTDSNGRFHSDWCSMIYSRLMLARNLLSDDGVIFISIGQDEIQNMINISNEVFGEENHISTVSRVMKSGGAQGQFFSPNIEYIAIYAKQITHAGCFREPISDEIIKRLYTSVEKQGSRVGEKYRPFGLYQASLTLERSRFARYFIECPDGSKCIPPEGKRWRVVESTYSTMLKNNDIEFKETKTSPLLDENGNQSKWNVYSKIWLSDRQEDGKVPVDLITKWENRQSKKDLQEIDIPFDFAKPVDLLKYLTDLVDNSKNSIVLDFFSGSATTAHAVMQLNAEDGGHRKFIMVQLPEKTDESSEAYKAGYKNICEIGKERIRRAGAKIKSETGADIDYGFRVLKLDDTNMQEVYYTPAETTQTMLAGFESNIKPDRTDLDLLFGCLLDWGLPLSMPYSSEQIEGVTVHTYNDGDLIACFDKAIPESVIKTIAKRQPLRVVFRDDSFADSPSKINVSEIFKMISPDTRVKVI